ncbi:MAG: MerR family transcriptional regulator [Fidelibacterota bacterium]
MSAEDANIRKLYYSIGEVSERTGLKQYVLRYWETEFPTLRPQKNRAGNRIYREKDIDMILKIKDLLYNQKYTIEGARRRLKVAASVSSDEKESDDEGKYEGLLKNVKAELEDILKILSRRRG